MIAVLNVQEPQTSSRQRAANRCPQSLPHSRCACICAVPYTLLIGPITPCNVIARNCDFSKPQYNLRHIAVCVMGIHPSFTVPFISLSIHPLSMTVRLQAAPCATFNTGLTCRRHRHRHRHRLALVTSCRRCANGEKALCTHDILRQQQAI